MSNSPENSPAVVLSFFEVVAVVIAVVNAPPLEQKQ